MIRTKDEAKEKTPAHLVALERLLPHDMAASELLALVLAKLKTASEDVNSLVLERETLPAVAVEAVPRLEQLASEVIKESMVEFNASLPLDKRLPPDPSLASMDFDLLSLLVRCEALNSPQLREQLRELTRAVLPMSLGVCPECSLPLTAEELEEEARVREQEEAAAAATAAVAAAAAAAAAGKKKKGGGASAARGLAKARK